MTTENLSPGGEQAQAAKVADSSNSYNQLVLCNDKTDADALSLEKNLPKHNRRPIIFILNFFAYFLCQENNECNSYITEFN